MTEYELNKCFEEIEVRMLLKFQDMYKTGNKEEMVRISTALAVLRELR